MKFLILSFLLCASAAGAQTHYPDLLGSYAANGACSAPNVTLTGNSFSVDGMTCVLSLIEQRGAALVLHGTICADADGAVEDAALGVRPDGDTFRFEIAGDARDLHRCGN